MSNTNYKKSSNNVLAGIAFIALGAICLINVGYIAQSLVIAFMFLFGIVSYWFIFPAFILVGIYLLINRNKNDIRIKKTHILIGLGLFYFSLLVLFTWIGTTTANRTILLTNFNDKFWVSWGEAAKLYNANGYIKMSPLATTLGGGYFGYIFTSLVNTFNPIATIVSTSIIMLFSLILIFYDLIRFIGNKITKKENDVKIDMPLNENKINENRIEPTVSIAKAEPQDFKSKDAEHFIPTKGGPSFFESSNEPLKKANIFDNNDEDIPLVNNPMIDEDDVTSGSSKLSNEVMPSNVGDINHTEFERPYNTPSLTLLNDPQKDNNALENEAACKTDEELINQAFADLRIGATVVGHTTGPRVTRYDIKVNANSSVQAIPKAILDLQQRLGGVHARFEAVVTGKSTAGLEVPNKYSEKIVFKEIISSFPNGIKNRLIIPFGKNITGEIKYAHLNKFPHLLVGGATGSGKSVFVHSIIMSLIMRNTPNDVRLLLIDPKRVEFTHYKDIPFLLCPVITDPKKAKVALEKLCEEMERRYSLFEESLTRDIDSYNEKVKDKNNQLPYIVTIVDEFADLITTNKKIDQDISRITAKARAAGIHLIIATQRPSVDVITGVIKANLPVRVALSVPDMESSKTILGCAGADELLSNGDMLVSCPEVQQQGLVRAQGCYVTDQEIDRVCEYIRNQRKPNYDPRFMDLEDHSVEPVNNGEVKITAQEAKAAQDDDLYELIKEQVYQKEYTSISSILRENGIGFTRAGRMFTRLQQEGLVSMDAESSKGSRVIKENFHFEKKENKVGSEEVSSTKPNIE